MDNKRKLPSKTTGYVLLGAGLLLLLTFCCDMTTAFSSGVEGTIIGSIVKSIWGENIMAYRIATTVVVFISIPITIIGAGIAFRKQK